MAKSKIVVDLFYDVISPYARVGFELLCRNRSVWPKMDLRLKPFLLGAVMKGAKNNPPMMVPNKALYMMEDLRRLSSMHQIALKVPSNFWDIVIAKGSLRAMRFVTAVDIHTKGESTEKISRALWDRIFCNEPGLDISENDSFKEVASKIGLSSEITEKCLKAIDSDEIKAKLKQNTNEAIEAGAFGAPTMLVHTGDKPEMIFGSDRIEMIAYLLEEDYALSFSKRAKL